MHTRPTERRTVMIPELAACRSDPSPGCRYVSAESARGIGSSSGVQSRTANHRVPRSSEVKQGGRFVYDVAVAALGRLVATGARWLVGRVGEWP